MTSLLHQDDFILLRLSIKWSLSILAPHSQLQVFSFVLHCAKYEKQKQLLQQKSNKKEK